MNLVTLVAGHGSWSLPGARTRVFCFKQKVETTATVSPSVCVPCMGASVTRISSSLLAIKLKFFCVVQNAAAGVVSCL